MNSKQLAKQAEVRSRRTRREARQQIKPTRPRNTKTTKPSRRGNGDGVLLVIMATGYLLTKKWFWITVLLVVLYGWLFV